MARSMLVQTVIISFYKNTKIRLHVLLIEVSSTCQVINILGKIPI